MSYKSFNDIPLITQIIVFFTGLWGAILNFIKREELHKDMPAYKKIEFFLIDLISSGGIATITFLGCVGYGLNELIAVAISGMMAHQGTRAMYIFELVLAEKLNSKALKEELKKRKLNKND